MRPYGTCLLAPGSIVVCFHHATVAVSCVSGEVATSYNWLPGEPATWDDCVQYRSNDGSSMFAWATADCKSTANSIIEICKHLLVHQTFALCFGCDKKVNC